jgi:hypothetical protein
MMVLRRKCVAYLILDKTCIYITSKTRPGPGGMHVVLMIQESFFFFFWFVFQNCSIQCSTPHLLMIYYTTS